MTFGVITSYGYTLLTLIDFVIYLLFLQSIKFPFLCFVYITIYLSDKGRTVDDFGISIDMVLVLVFPEKHRFEVYGCYVSIFQEDIP